MPYFEHFIFHDRRSRKINEISYFSVGCRVRSIASGSQFIAIGTETTAWLTPPQDTSIKYLSAKTTVRDCCHSVVDLVKVLGGPSEGLEFEVCPVPDSGKDFLRKFEMVCQRELDGVDDGKTLIMKGELKRDPKNGED